MSILDDYAKGAQLFGSGYTLAYRPTATGVLGSPEPTETHGQALSVSADGWVSVIITGTDAAIVIPTDIAVKPGDYVSITITGTQMRVTGVVGGGDRTAHEVQGAVTAAVEAANVASDALAEAAIAQDQANEAAAAALAADQKADAAAAKAEAAKNKADEAARETAVAKEKADDAAMDAALAQVTAGSKSKTFYGTANPTPPYAVGDIWAFGPSGDIKYCKVAKAAGKAYAAGDWEVAAKYTDNTAASAAQSTANTANSAASAAQSTANTASTAAGAAQSTANAANSLAAVKRRNFTATPTVPYDIGDLWTQNGVVKVCKTARATGSYTAADWTVQATDDTAANEAQATADAAQAGVGNLTTTVQTALVQTQESILATVMAQYVKTGDFSRLEATVASQFAVMADGISMNFYQQAQTINTVSNSLMADQILRQTYIRFTASGIELGKLDSPFKTVIDNTHIGFLQDGTEVAGISNQNLNITNATVKAKLTIGAENVGQFAWWQKSNGNLSFGRV